MEDTSIDNEEHLVLLASGEPGERNAILAVLEKAGFCTIVATSGKATIDSFGKVQPESVGAIGGISAQVRLDLSRI